MRFSVSTLLPSALALLLVSALVLAGCDSGGGPEEELGQNTAFSFASERDTVSEDVGSIDLRVQINDPGYQSNSVEVVFDEEASTLDRSELVGFSAEDMTIQFEESATTGQAQTVSFGIEDDDIYNEGPETAVFRLQAPESGSISQGAFTLVVSENDNTISIAEARAMEDGEFVAVDGIITRQEGINVRIQDQSGEDGATGIVVRADTLATALDMEEVALGDRIVALGELGSFSGLRQISEGDVSFQLVEEGAGLPEPQTVTLEELSENGEAYESELVRVENLFFADPSGTFEGGTTYTVQNQSGTTFDLRIQGDVAAAFEGMEIPDGAFTFEGILGQFTIFGNLPPDAGYQLLPTRPSDIAPGASGARFGFAGSSYTLAYEEGGSPGTVTVRAQGLADGQEASVTVTANDAGGELSGNAAQTLTFTGPDPATQTASFEALSDGEEEGVEPFEVTLTSDDGVTPSSPRTLWILDDETAQATLFAGSEGNALISDIQNEYGEPATFDDYGVARDTLYGTVFNEGGIVHGLYTGYEAPLEGGDPSEDAFEDGVNTEHTWPQSKGADSETPAGRDLHILVPAWADANQARCNYPYDEIDDSNTERWFGANGGTGIEQTTAPPQSERDAYSESIGNDCGNPSSNGVFEPRESVKGDVARKLFYFHTVWPDQSDDTFFEAQRDILLQWNAQDPPSAEETRRNVIAATFQNQVINPFVVDPTLAERAYGNSQ